LPQAAKAEPLSIGNPGALLAAQHPHAARSLGYSYAPAQRLTRFLRIARLGVGVQKIERLNVCSDGAAVPNVTAESRANFLQLPILIGRCLLSKTV
jgi:hypothetical protein